MGGANTIRHILRALVAVATLGACTPPPPTASIGRGAADPPPAPAIVGSEGKGLWAGAGVPPEHPPIFAARDGAIPKGVQREVRAGSDGLTYLSIHRRRSPLVIGVRPARSS